jgi:hypothetical protein
MSNRRKIRSKSKLKRAQHRKARRLPNDVMSARLYYVDLHMHGRLRERTA